MMKSDIKTPDISSKNGIPEYCIWRIMRSGTKRPISQEAIEAMQEYITNLIKDRTARADAIQDDLNKKLPERLRRKRIIPEIIREVCNNV